MGLELKPLRQAPSFAQFLRSFFFSLRPEHDSNLTSEATHSALHGWRLFPCELPAFLRRQRRNKACRTCSRDFDARLPPSDLQRLKWTPVGKIHSHLGLEAAKHDGKDPSWKSRFSQSSLEICNNFREKFGGRWAS